MVFVEFHRVNLIQFSFLMWCWKIIPRDISRIDEGSPTKRYPDPYCISVFVRQRGCCSLIEYILTYMPETWGYFPATPSPPTISYTNLKFKMQP